MIPKSAKAVAFSEHLGRVQSNGLMHSGLTRSVAGYAGRGIKGNGELLWGCLQRVAACLQLCGYVAVGGT